MLSTAAQALAEGTRTGLSCLLEMPGSLLCITFLGSGQSHSRGPLSKHLRILYERLGYARHIAGRETGLAGFVAAENSRSNAL